MNLENLIEITSGSLINKSNESLGNIKINDISIDSRTIQTGDVFIAIKGDKFDGHDFIQEVISKGTICCLISDKNCLESLNKELCCNIVLVDDTTKAFGQIAKYIISNFNFPVIAITGSCGKTTTKEALAAILKTKGNVLYSEKSFNNHVGVPLTALKALKNNQDYVAAIFEIGTNHRGEIDYLTKIVRPNVAILTKVAPVHIGNFGSIDDLVYEKQQIFKYLNENNLAIVNQDDFYKYKHEKANTKYFAIDTIDNADIYASDIVLNKKQLANFNLHYQNKKININSPLLGKHNIYNILSAALAALNLGYTLDDVKEGIEKNLKAISGRLEIKSGINDSIIIDDAYNANPIAVKASLDILANYENNSKKCFVFADMGELGDDAKLYHKEIGQIINEMGIDYFFAYGELVKYSIDNYNKLENKLENKLGNKVGIYCSSKDDLTLKLKELLNKEKGLTLLFKGSNSMGLKDVVNNLVNK